VPECLHAGTFLFNHHALPLHLAVIAPGLMRSKTLLLAVLSTAILMSTAGCAVVSVATTAATVAGTAVNVGLGAGSMAVSAATTVAKGAVTVGGAVLGSDEE